MSQIWDIILRLILAVVCGTISLTCFQFAWEIIRHRPTHAEMAAERKRRTLAKMFRAMSGRAKP